MDEQTRTRGTGSSGPSGNAVAVILSSLALLISLGALYNSSDAMPDVAAEALQESREVRQETRKVLARAEARMDLFGIRTRVEAEDNLDEAADQVAQIRANLEVAYDDADAVARQELREMDAALAEVEDDLREGSANVLETIESAIDRLGRDVRTDE